MDAANVLLGSAYASDGVVRPGRQLGRTIGFPTLNLPWAPDLRPRLGVYVVSVRRADRGVGALRAVANYGLRPTVEADATAPQLEVPVLEADCPFGPGDVLEVEWLAFVRPERKFADVGELRAQIAKDRDAARAWFGM